VLDVGTVIAGKLRIERILGQGGMGVVAEATHLQLDQRVAVKVMRDAVANDPDTVERFMREARAAAKLKSEHVCRVSDVGQLDSGAPYIVMELLTGSDLAHLLAQKPLTIPTAVDYVLQASIAIAEAHVLGIVHRDLKPANLFLTKHVGGAPLVKVLDFGIAKAPSKVEAGITATESVMGSPGYMSPEQLRSSRDVDVRTDLWALGVILYQLVSGRLPFPATSVTELAVKVAMDPPDALDGDPAFVAAVMRCLEKEPAARFKDIAAFATALAPLGTDSARRSLAVIEQLTPKADSFASTLPAIDVNAPTAASIKIDVHAPTAAPQPITTLGGAATAFAPTAPPTTPPNRKRGLVLGGIGLAAAGSIATYVAVGRSDERAAPTPAPSPPIVTAPPVDAPTVVAAPPVDAPTVVAESRPPIAEPPPVRTPASPKVAPKNEPAPDLLGTFDKAVASMNCREASRRGEAGRSRGAADRCDKEVGGRTNPRRLGKGAAPSNPCDPARIRIILIWGEELVRDKLPKEGRELVENNILRGTPDSVDARTFVIRAACIEKNGDVARAHAAKLPSIPTVPACTKAGIDLKTKGANEPTPDIPADWKKQAEEELSMYSSKDALDLALVVLAKRPNDQDALTIATRAYCQLGKTANAREYAAKLDATHLANVKKRECDGFDLSPSTK